MYTFFQALECCHLHLNDISLSEVEHCCSLIGQLSLYQNQWRLELSENMNIMLKCVSKVTETCTYLLSRPTLLEQMIQTQNRIKENTTKKRRNDSMKIQDK